MKVQDLIFSDAAQGDSYTLVGAKCDYGRITVLDCLTGFRGGTIRDVETGFKDHDSKMWIASGDIDIRMYPHLTIEEAIAFIKEKANTLVGV